MGKHTGHRTVMDPAERDAMDDLEWSRGFDNSERPEGSTDQEGQVMSTPTSGDPGSSQEESLKDEPDSRNRDARHQE